MLSSSLLIFTIVSLFLTALAHADFQAGLDAYNRGDYLTAQKEWKPLAEKGDASAQFYMGVSNALGRGVKLDYQKALHWYQMASELGHVEAQFNIGVMYHEGQGLQKDFQAASRWYRLAAEQGLAEAQANLGVLYLNGQGVAQNNQEALFWFKLAAEQENDQAQFMLGNMFLLGRGVLENRREAIKWWRKVADNGNDYGQLQLCLTNAGSHMHDKVEAYKWCILSGSQGNKNAESVMEFIGQDMSEEQIAEAHRLAQAWLANRKK